MPNKNPIHEAIARHVVKPALAARRQSVEGSIVAVDYYNQIVDVYWRDHESGAERYSEKVPMPVNGDGIYKQSLEMGDMVTLNFKNGNHANPYISIVHKKQVDINFDSDNGASIPKGAVDTQTTNTTWQSDLIDLKYSHGKIDHDSEDAKDYVIKEKEIALKHPETGAVVKLTDDGLIDVFAGAQVGVRIDPHNKSVNIFGDNVNITANSFNVNTRTTGSPNTKVRYSDGLITIMKDLGLPVEKA